ncbi:hypothetical protein [Bactrocera dorsalis toti-like virus 2]|uniref:Uncharacterized protein n=1 Tax=Bactrocera dorsalis toti-like virus 2 TaxID=2760898 RepID=A0A7G4YW93_9VIRU|nr:hypothetical protein [Bactrocera dorsalis toti-like virus 2]
MDFPTSRHNTMVYAPTTESSPPSARTRSRYHTLLLEKIRNLINRAFLQDRTLEGQVEEMEMVVLPSNLEVQEAMEVTQTCLEDLHHAVTHLQDKVAHLQTQVTQIQADLQAIRRHQEEVVVLNTVAQQKRGKTSL